MRKATDLQKGDKLSASELNRLFGELERVSKITANHPLEVVSNQAGMLLRYIDNSILAQLSSGTVGGQWAWKETQPDGSGGWTIISGGRQGNTSTNPAYSVPINSPAASGDVVTLYPGRDQEYYFFDDDGGTTTPWSVSYQSGNFTASGNLTEYVVNVQSGGVTATLPSNAVSGQITAFKVAYPDNSQTLTVNAASGQLIELSGSITVSSASGQYTCPGTALIFDGNTASGKTPTWWILADQRERGQSGAIVSRTVQGTVIATSGLGGTTNQPWLVSYQSGTFTTSGSQIAYICDIQSGGYTATLNNLSTSGTILGFVVTTPDNGNLLTLSAAGAIDGIYGDIVLGSQSGTVPNPSVTLVYDGGGQWWTIADSRVQGTISGQVWKDLQGTWVAVSGMQPWIVEIMSGYALSGGNLSGGIFFDATAMNTNQPIEYLVNLSLGNVTAQLSSGGTPSGSVFGFKVDGFYSGNTLTVNCPTHTDIEGNSAITLASYSGTITSGQMASGGSYPGVVLIAGGPYILSGTTQLYEHFYILAEDRYLGSGIQVTKTTKGVVFNTSISGGLTGFSFGYSGLPATWLMSGSALSGAVGSGAVYGSFASGWDVIASGSIGGNDLGSGAVWVNSIGSGAVLSNNIGSGAVSSGRIGDAAVGSGNYQSGSIGHFKIAANSILSGQINMAGVPSSGKFFAFNYSWQPINATIFPSGAGGLPGNGLYPGPANNLNIYNLIQVAKAHNTFVARTLATGTYSPFYPYFPTSTFVAVSPTGNVTFNGFGPGTHQVGFQKVIYNTGPGTITLVNNNAGSPVGTRFFNPAGGNKVLAPGQSATVMYDGTFWIVLDPVQAVPIGLTAFSGLQNNLQFATFGEIQLLSTSGTVSGGYNITGLLAPTSGQALDNYALFNCGSGNIVLTYNDTTDSNTGSQIMNSAQADYILSGTGGVSGGVGGSVLVTYDYTNNWWALSPFTQSDYIQDQMAGSFSGGDGSILIMSGNSISGANFVAVQMGGDATINDAGVITFASGSVTSGDIGNGAIVGTFGSGQSIASGTIGGYDLGSGAVWVNSIGSGAVLSGNIASGSIGLNAFASGITQLITSGTPVPSNFVREWWAQAINQGAAGATKTISTVGADFASTGFASGLRTNTGDFMILGPTSGSVGNMALCAGIGGTGIGQFDSPVVRLAHSPLLRFELVYPTATDALSGNAVGTIVGCVSSGAMPFCGTVAPYCSGRGFTSGWGWFSGTAGFFFYNVGLPSSGGTTALSGCYTNNNWHLAWISGGTVNTIDTGCLMGVSGNVNYLTLDGMSVSGQVTATVSNASGSASYIINSGLPNISTDMYVYAYNQNVMSGSSRFMGLGSIHGYQLR